jgi:hypothetical protein
VIHVVGKLVKQQLWSKGQQWTAQAGRILSSRTNVPASPSAAVRAAFGAARHSPDWTIVNKTSRYGVDLNEGSLKFDTGNKILAFNMISQ